MKMNKMFTGLIALVAGVALSAGSAFATAGYVGSDPAVMKLVPYFETGESKATIVNVQNLSPQESATMDLHAAVTAAQAALDALNDMDDPDLQMVADAEMALADAMEALQTEHLFVSVNVYDAMGVLMDNASAELCLAENQFGYVILQGFEMMSWQEDIPNRSAILSVPDGDIPAYGYVEITAGDKWSACAPTAGARGEAGWSQIFGGEEMESVTGRIASWTIIQDTGTGFFGTEVQTATLSMSSVPGIAADDDDPAIDAGDAMLACYGGDGTPSTRVEGDNTMAENGVASNMEGDFMMGRCGLIPERHDNSRITDDPEGDTQGNPDSTVEIAAGNEAARADNTDGLSATPRAHAIARYGTGADDSMVYVWLATGEDTADTHARDSRMLDVTIVCEDGMMIDMMQDTYGDDVPMQVPAPNKVTMIDPSDDTMLGMYTGMCAGDRGVLRITMPDGSTAGSVFTHISQMGNNFRMNFPAYSAASPMTCYEMGFAANAADTAANDADTANVLPVRTVEAAAAAACMAR